MESLIDEILLNYGCGLKEGYNVWDTRLDLLEIYRLSLPFLTSLCDGSLARLIPWILSFKF